MNEVWKPVKGYEGLYEVSNQGEVKSLRTNMILTPVRATVGYMKLSLCRNGEIKNRYIHRIVAQAFIPNPNNLPQVNHKDEDKTNNAVSNLEWCTPKHNMHYGEMGKLRWIKTSNALSKPVIQLKDGIEIARYPSGAEAARAMGVTNMAISNVLRGKTRTSKGFQWKYAKGESTCQSSL